MAVTGNTTTTNVSQIANTGDRLALSLKVFSGEIIETFERRCAMMPLHMVQTIQSGRASQFPITGVAMATYHVPGTNIFESNNGMISKIQSNERTINIDGSLMSAIFIDNLEEKMLHYDTRSIFARQMANALAIEADKRILRAGLLGARAGKNITDFDGYRPIASGTVLERGEDVATSAAKLRAAIAEAAQILDENDIHKSDRYIALRLAQWYLLSEDSARQYVEWSKGQYVSGMLNPICGITPVLTNNLPDKNPLMASSSDINNYTHPDGFEHTVGLVWHRDAIGTVKLQDLATEQEKDFDLHGWKMKAYYAMGHGYLRPEALIEISKAVK